MNIPKYLLLASLAFAPHSSEAEIFRASDYAPNDQFGFSVSVSGGLSLVGARQHDDGGSNTGSAYLFYGPFSANNPVIESAKLDALNPRAGQELGYSVAISGTQALVGAYADQDNLVTNSGTVYLFKNLDTASGPITSSTQLKASDATSTRGYFFGTSVSMSGNIGIVGATDGPTRRGGAYLFRNLDTATGTVYEAAILRGTDTRQQELSFGRSVSVDGAIAIVGSDTHGTLATPAAGIGAAYVYRNLDTATGLTYQNLKLTASDGVAGDRFGRSVSISGSTGLVGAFLDTNTNGAQAGSAYLFRSLDTKSGTTTEDVRLTASDGAANDQFGTSVSISGNTGIVGAAFHDSNGTDAGAAYLFLNLNSASSSATENIKITQAIGASSSNFGSAVSLDGDDFVIGASGSGGKAGLAYSGSVSSLTTLNHGDAARRISGISFSSHEHWIIGSDTSRNIITLASESTANITAANRVVYIGEQENSNENELTIDGTVLANEVRVGATGNEGNALVINGSVTANLVSISADSLIKGAGTINGNLTLEESALFGISSPSGLTVTGSVDLQSSFGIASIIALDGFATSDNYTLFKGSLTDFELLNLQNWGLENAYDLGDNRYAYLWQNDLGSLSVTVIPEPGSFGLVLLSAGVVYALRRVRKSSPTS